MYAGQKTFDGSELFSWTDDGWYTFDYEASVKKARKDRDAYAKEAKKEGFQVVKFSLGTQERKKGGINSGHPEIDFVTKCYGVNVYEK